MLKFTTRVVLIFSSLFVLLSCEILTDSLKDAFVGGTADNAVPVSNRAALMLEIDKAIKTHGPTADLNYIDTSKVQDMNALFKDNKAFNGDISKWDTKLVTTMEGMFAGASSFNGDISKWDTKLVTTMEGMFAGASSFNGDISEWDTSQITSMAEMFKDASAFNRDISKWDTSQVITTKEMFKGAKAFAQNLVHWDMNKVTARDNMFDGATSITSAQHPLLPVTPTTKAKLIQAIDDAIKNDRPHLNYIITSKITDMSGLFKDNKAFNRDISKWDTSQVTTMEGMFAGASIFNGDISKWGY